MKRIREDFLDYFCCFQTYDAKALSLSALSATALPFEEAAALLDGDGALSTVSETEAADATSPNVMLFLKIN